MKLRSVRVAFTDGLSPNRTAVSYANPRAHRGSRKHPFKWHTVSFCYRMIITKLETLSIRKKRSEDFLDVAEHTITAHPQNAIPVNHNEVRRSSPHGNFVAQTINTSCYLWGGGPATLSRRERGLKIGYLNKIRSYSTKAESQAASWNDTKVAKRLQTL